MNASPLLSRIGLTILPVFALIYAGCGKPQSDTVVTEDGRTLTRVVLQTDWYAQPEHGGFYEAMLSGLYEDAGLAVTINQGGPGAYPIEKVVSGRANFSIGRVDDIVTYADQGKPFVIVGVFMQHDPQAIMLHASNPIKGFADLDGKTVMAIPGSNWLKGIEKKFDVTIPEMAHDYGMERFLADPGYIQQCFVTNEPYYVEKNGIDVKTLLISDSGFDPYRVIYTTRDYADANPEIVKAFVDASVKGWVRYMKTAPSDSTNTHLISLNLKLDLEFVAYSMETMTELQLISGDPDKGDYIGRFEPTRIQQSIDDLNEIGALETEVTLEQVIWQH
ncbi:MAG: ABC transporter substrate-binding protein [Verrucomicrobiota bacterium]